MGALHHPTEIQLHRDRRQLVISFDDGSRFELPAELLRVYSPSSKVAGYHSHKPILQLGKEQVNIDDVQQVGLYAVRLVFDDGHHSGLYTWDYLYDLGANRQARWADYLHRLEKGGYRRNADS